MFDAREFCRRALRGVDLTVQNGDDSFFARVSKGTLAPDARTTTCQQNDFSG